MNNKWKVLEVPIGEVIGTEVNANQMSKKNFDKLVGNIQKSGMSSMIACYKREEDGKYVIISGNHRYRACVKLGYSKLNILYAYESELTRDEIESIDYKEFAHISVDDLEVEDMFSGSIVPVSEHYKVSLVLYRRDMELLDELLDIVQEESDTSDMVIMANGDEVEDEFVDAITQAKKQFEIKSVSIAFSKILQLAKESMVAEVTETNKKENE